MQRGEIEVRHLKVERTARYALLGGDVARPRELWIACHGYRQLAARFARDLAPLDDGTRRIAAPEGLSRFYLDDDGGPHGPDAKVGATWMTRDDRLSEIADYVAYLDRLAAALVERDAAPRVIALGFSQGAATAARWAALGATRVHELILWGSGMPHDLDLVAHAQRLRETRVWLVAGERDRFFAPTAAEAQRARLAEHGVVAEVVAFGGGHAMDGEVLAGIGEGVRERG